MTNFCDDCKLAERSHKLLECYRNRASDKFFVRLGQFSSNCNGTVANDSQDLSERAPDPMRRLEEDDGPAGPFQCLEPRISVFRPNRGEAEEEEGPRVN